jgi:diguanylate cyclase (GGDEF)-like protein
MTLRNRPPGSASGQTLPPELYASLVASLYDEARTLLVGSVMAAGAVLLTYWKSGEPLLMVCAVAVALIAFVRHLDMRSFKRQQTDHLSPAAVHAWERRYAGGAAASVLLLGIWCYVGLAVTDDPVIHMISFSITIAYVVGISGRNFGSDRLVIAQILCAWAPMTAGLLAYGGAYHYVFAGLLVPFFIGLKFISDRLRQTLLHAVTATRDMSFLAMRFDTALNNMPHGLCMLDSERRIVVSNRRMNQLLGLPPNLDPKGMDSRQLVQICGQAGTIDTPEAKQLSRSFEARLNATKVKELVLDTRDGHTLEMTFQPMATGGMVVLIQDITERKLAEARINHLARFDALTGLPNRMVLRDRLYQGMVESTPGHAFAIHFIDLDDFKQVNDTLGHPRGDMLLQAVADRLQGIISDTDLVVRFGGDEFVVLQSPVEALDEASTLARHIVEGVGRPYTIDGHQVVIGASIGIALSPKDGVDADQLLKNADMALYSAKSHDRGTWRFFRPEMGVDTQARRNLELDLRHALQREQFKVYYQPIIDPRTNRITACEALLRWAHPDRGMVQPAEFIPVAEEMGTIVEIGNWVLRQACLECCKWPEDISVAVNLSPVQFDRSDLPTIVRQTLAETGLPASRLELEITEMTLLHDTRGIRAALLELQDIGVRISLDDFGTGYSSLSYLHSFPLHKVKIDRSFLQGLGDSDQTLTLLRGVTRLSAELGLSVTVEGIETLEQLELISSDGSVDGAQGYLFGKPAPASVTRRLLYTTLPHLRRPEAAAAPSAVA